MSNRISKLFQNGILGLHEWTCPNCGIHHDRDVNAGLNLKEERDREWGPMSE
ncbi:MULTISPECIES: zinc ribbon domain-containing protein [unclassified Exiguobacterium]|uniref:zinc ribbon domain-containing protein n=1 Tax=unclassified Exiguobacterium TaxID=2644629 RepID=UPI001BE89E21